ncbi:HipA domain-containing protein [Shewanella putrefaciens]|uniref:HipA domain-containing protein n=1 Tax=Shewanella putrefaciens TaxID=24 RepID=UPI00285E412C|nr:HipA domain-containing protein [Shewanella putrefaciens]MDR6963058.1 serine/threonine-protein kinase HipA [Shewanella putrefaciens]
MTFSIADVSELQIDFIEYAQSRGAAAGGASGAGGAAPKLLVLLSEVQGIWIDTFQDDPSNLDQLYLLKFPRGKTSLDIDILRAEYHFYHKLTQMGFETIPVESMKLIESERGPSLWLLPRFDYGVEAGAMVSYGMESVYAILGEPTAKPLFHSDVIRRLLAAFNKKENYGNTTTLLEAESGIEAFVIEWVRRDLLNIAFGNSDNHGRNTSFIKYGNRVQFVPIYDFAPMKVDYEMITRIFTWGEGMELGGVYNFPAIAEHLADLVTLKTLLSALNETAVSLLGLKQRLSHRGPVSILALAHSGIGYASLDARMQQY